MKNKRQLIVISLIFVQFIVALNYTSYCQTMYSEKALIGVGDLNFDGNDVKLQKEVFEAFYNMQNAALKDSISIQIVSAYRSYKRQKKIWNRKFKKYTSQGFSEIESINKIIEYSTIPGTSRHHWGTDIDIVDNAVEAPKKMLIEDNYTSGGVYSKLKNWMDLNSENYGFYLVYDNNTARKGFKYEPWHFSYKLVSKPMLKDFLTVDLIRLLQKKDIAGSYLFSEDFLKKYISEQVLDINLNLK